MLGLLLAAWARLGSSWSDVEVFSSVSNVLEAGTRSMMEILPKPTEHIQLLLVGALWGLRRPFG
eukprot:4151387-Pyramimonas_sp.AAC.1